MNRRAIIVLSLVIAAAGGLFLARAAQGGDSINFKIYGNSPLTAVRGVNAAGNPWVTDNSRAKLYADGTLDIKIRGLVLAAGVTGSGGTVPANVVGTNPVAVVRLDVTWMVAGVPVVHQETGPLPLDPNGDLSARVNIGEPPAGAERPIVLVRAGPAAGTGPFIASSDFVEDWGSAH